MYLVKFIELFKARSVNLVNKKKPKERYLYKRYIRFKEQSEADIHTYMCISRLYKTIRYTQNI